MNRNSHFSNANQSRRGNAATNGSAANSQCHTPSLFSVDKPLVSSDHGHQQMDESNPFSHLALEVEMDRPSANPFDNGIMPSFDDNAIENAYRYESFKKACVKNRDDRKLKKTATRVSMQSPLLFDEPVSINRYAVNVTHKDAKRDVTPVPNISDELNLDDFFLPKQSDFKSSIDLKPQINIRSSKTFTRDEIKTRVNIPRHKPVVEPVSERVISPAPSTKPIIDYFGTQSYQPNTEIDEKEKYFKESQLEANIILFGVQEPTRPLTNLEVSKRKKLILKLVDQKLKEKLSQLMNQFTERAKMDALTLTSDNVNSQDFNDTFDNQMQNLVPDSVPDNVPNRDNAQNWVSNPSISNAQTRKNLELASPNKDREENWQMHLPNVGWMDLPHTNPYPPGVDHMHQNIPQWQPSQWQHNIRAPTNLWEHQHNWNMSVRPINPNFAQSNMNFPYSSDNQFPFLSNIPPVPTVLHKSAAEFEQEFKEREFLERTLLGSKNIFHGQKVDLDQHKSPDKLKRRSRERSRRLRDVSRRSADKSKRSRDRSRRSNDRSKQSHDRFVRSRSRSSRGRLKRCSPERLRDRSYRESERSNLMSSNQSVERLLHHDGISLSRLSPSRESPLRLLRDRSLSKDSDWFEENKSFMHQALFESLSNCRSGEDGLRRSSARSEDLRLKLSQLRKRDHPSRSPDDLRNKLLSDRSDSRKSHDLRYELMCSDRRSGSPSRHQSTSKRSKKHADDESMWIKFNNIVGMLMNISTENDSGLTTEQLSEKKEIMKLLLENPDLLELDNNFVYKFGKSRLNLAVKEAENILYPNGIPDERIASLISHKIAAMSTDSQESDSKSKETVPIEWIKLCSIVDQVLGLPVGLRKNLPVTDKRMIERDDLLLKISHDPSTLLPLGAKYGHRNVEWAVKFANKILCHNGVRDKRVDVVISKERDNVLKRAPPKKARSLEWDKLNQLATKIIRYPVKIHEKLFQVDILRKNQLLVKMSRDPVAILQDTNLTNDVDKDFLNKIIDECKQIVTSVNLNPDKQVVRQFELSRSKAVADLKSPRPITIHEKIRLLISQVCEKGVVETVIKNPESLKTNANAVEKFGDNLDNVISDIKEILTGLDPSKARLPKPFHISSSKVIDIPFVVKIEDASNQLNDNTKTILLKALRDMISEIENPPKPKLLQQRYIDNRVEVVCANLLTFEWLKRAILSDFPDKWNGAQLKSERVPVNSKISRDGLKSVVVIFKTLLSTLPFDDIMDKIKRQNPKLYTERWEYQCARSKNGDYMKKTIGIDIESLAVLEQMNRFARIDRQLIYFDIVYMGDNVPNFEAIIQ